MDETIAVLEPGSKITDRPIMATDTGLTHFGKRILIEGNSSDAERLRRTVEACYPLLPMFRDRKLQD